MGAIISGAFVVECKPERHADGNVYFVNFRVWLECDADELNERRESGKGAEPDVTGSVKWDGCINWQAGIDCMAHGCGPHHADTIAGAFREVYRRGRELMTNPDWEGARAEIPKRCGTCKHWGPPAPRGERLGCCLASSRGIRDHSPVTGERLMDAMCDEDRGYLLTSPEFGCVHWEAKG